MKKVLIITPHFHPETFKCNEMAIELSRRGWDVSVMTAIPDYPKGKYFDGYGLFKRRRETWNNIRINRTFIVPRGKGSPFRIAINYLSYSIFAILKAFWIGLFHKYDYIIVHETSPIMVGIPGVIIKKMQKIPMHFWVLDLWPESLEAAGGIKNKFILNSFGHLTKWIYKHCDSLMIGSRGFEKSICQKGNFKDKIVYFPNWIEDVLLKRQNFNKNRPPIPEGFNVMITGNMGDAQDIPHILKAAKSLSNNNVNFIFVGDGRKKEFAEKFVSDNHLSNVFFLGRHPLENMPLYFNKADVLMMALKDTPIFSLTVPSRLQAYMSSGKPVVAMINGDGADLIAEADCGWTVPAEDSEALANLLLRLSKEDPKILIKKGQNGRAFSDRHFNFSKCIDHLEEIINR